MANESETKKKTTTTNTAKKKTNGNTPKKKTTNNQPKKNNNQAAKKNTNGVKKSNNTPKKKTNTANKNLENTLEMPIKKAPKHAAGNKKKTNNNTPKKKTNNQPKKVQTPKVEAPKVELPKKVEPKVEVKEEVKVEIKKAEVVENKKIKEKEEVEKVIEHINEKEFDPKKVSPAAVDTKAERDRIVQAYVEKEEVSDNLKKINREIRKEARAAAADKRDKLIDLGILVVIVGLFILVLTTYLTGSLDLSYTITNYLVIAALAVEAIGIIVIIYNSIRKK